MKKFVRILFVSVFVISLFLSACAPPPPPVTKSQLDIAESEAVAAEQKATELKTDMNSLEDQLSAKQAELQSLKRYHKQLLAEDQE